MRKAGEGGGAEGEEEDEEARAARDKAAAEAAARPGERPADFWDGLLKEQHNEAAAAAEARARGGVGGGCGFPAAAALRCCALAWVVLSLTGGACARVVCVLGAGGAGEGEAVAEGGEVRGERRGDEQRGR